MGFVLLCLHAAPAAAGDASVRYVITNGGTDVGGNGQTHYVAHGKHDGPEISWAGSGDTAQIPAGKYDVHVIFSDGAAHKEFWLDNQSFAGHVEKTVELNLPLTDVRYVVTNGGEDTRGNGQTHYFAHGKHDGPEIVWAGSGDSVRMPQGTYDVHMSFSDGAAHKEFWIDNQTFTGTVEKTVEIGLPVAEVRYTITNGGEDTHSNGQIHFVRHGKHDGPEIVWASSGDSVRLPAGAYDAHVIFDDGPLHKEKWLDNQIFADKVEQTVEIGANHPVAEVRYVITNGGVDVQGNGQTHFVPHGHHDGPEVAWSSSGDTIRMLQDVYDVHVSFNDGAAHKEFWIDNQTFTGTVEKTVEIGLPVAEVRYTITNGGEDTHSNGQIHFVRHGKHDGPEIVWASSGDSVRLPAGAYDAHVIFDDGPLHKEKWLDNQIFADKVEQTVEIGANHPVAEVRYVITNGGVDVQGNGQTHFVPHGHHDGPEVAWSSSGDTIRMLQDVYDVHVSFSDGAAHKEFWIDNQSFAGKVDKTVEIGMPVAEVRYAVTNNGEDVRGDGQAHYFAHGHRDGGEIAWAESGDPVRLAAGTYDVAIRFEKGLVHKTVWQDNQNLSGKVERTVELGLKLAQPTVAVTQKGADAGDQATVGYVDPATHNEIGVAHSGETALLEAGSYDIHASLFDAEGWLRHTALSGQQHFIIDLKPVKTEQLKVGGPPPTACAIEVYGVNFDFDKAVLRPDSEPMLKQILALFTQSPAFSAEIGGHTDNVGKPDYNVKLSDARAAAVKAWLMAHGVAPARVTSHGYGDTKPLLPNTTDENRFKNRRVELRTANCR